VNSEPAANTSPLVSVIIPTYNRADVISLTIDNVFSQTYKNIELILIDDGSTDNTQAILSTYGSRIRVITQANAGPAAARNRGIEVSQGSIIAFQDSDDLWKPTKLERQVALMSHFDDSVPCCLCNASYTVPIGRRNTSFDNACINPSHEEGLWINVAEVLATRFVLFNQTVAIRRSALEKVGGFDESLKYMEDYDLPLRLAVEGPWAFIHDPLVVYRLGTANSYGQRAARDIIVLTECEIAILERALLRAKRIGDTSLHRLLLSRLGRVRRLLLSAKLSQSDSIAARSIGSTLKCLDGVWEKGLRRSPWYPNAETVSLNCRYPRETESDNPHGAA
jgi:glycosyltransferase involved in cell wall biosynthesis